MALSLSCYQYLTSILCKGTVQFILLYMYLFIYFFLIFIILTYRCLLYSHPYSYAIIGYSH